MKIFKLGGNVISEAQARNLATQAYLNVNGAHKSDLAYVDWLFKTVKWGFTSYCRDKAAQTIAQLEPRLIIEEPAK